MGGHPAPPHPFILQNCVYELIYIRQKDLNVILLKRREFKLSIGGLNNDIPYAVQKLAKIL